MRFHHQSDHRLIPPPQFSLWTSMEQVAPKPPLTAHSPLPTTHTSFLLLPSSFSYIPSPHLALPFPPLSPSFPSFLLPSLFCLLPPSLSQRFPELFTRAFSTISFIQPDSSSWYCIAFHLIPQTPETEKSLRNDHSWSLRFRKSFTIPKVLTYTVLFHGSPSYPKN